MQRRYQQVAGVHEHSNACISAPLRLRAAASRDVRARGLGDFFKNIMDFDNWAPKSTKVWRLQQYEYQGQQPETEQEQKGQYPLLHVAGQAAGLLVTSQRI